MKKIFIGTDSGATTSKTGGVWADGTTVSTQLLQSSTNAQTGTAAVVRGWLAGIDGFLAQHRLGWGDVGGVGLALPGPYQRYGVLAKSANLPASFAGWNFLDDYSQALAAAAGRKVPLVVGNDGLCGGVAEAQRVCGGKRASVLMLAPGSGLGSAFIDADGRALAGDTLAGMETAHMPAPLHLLGMKAFPCGCGRTWGCIETYTTISGLPHLLGEMLKSYPDHELARSTLSVREQVLSLRSRAQHDDPLAVRIFDFQAKALGLHVANLCLALDPTFVVIGGGLMDPEATTPAFRERFLDLLRATARLYLWPAQRESITIQAAQLGELSQAIGAALMARHALATVRTLANSGFPPAPAPC